MAFWLMNNFFEHEDEDDNEDDFSSLDAYARGVLTRDDVVPLSAEWLEVTILC